MIRTTNRCTDSLYELDVTRGDVAVTLHAQGFALYADGHTSSGQAELILSREDAQDLMLLLENALYNDHTAFETMRAAQMAEYLVKLGNDEDGQP